MPATQEDKSRWSLKFGANPTSGGVHFQLWAPNARTVSVCISAAPGANAPAHETVFAMERDADSVFRVLVPGVTAGAEYLFEIDGDKRRPDPVSRSQPHGVHGTSRVIDPGAFTWADAGWKGLSLEEYIIYEMHVGIFTEAGTFEAVIGRLPFLRDLGVTALELMPVVEFPGTRNWGYDGVDLYAPHSAYGGADGLKRLIDASHRAGLAVIIDVVYNHLGPEGNYLGDYAPCFSTRYRAPWGAAINFDGALSDGMRRFFADNALYWLAEYHADALRLDAIHEIYDLGARHILQQIAEAFHNEAATLGRDAFLLAESDLNDVRVIKPAHAGGHDLDAQWSDDFHHALHSLLTGKTHGYFGDFGGLDDLRKALAEGFVNDGRYSRFRRRRHGNSSAQMPGKRFVIFNQNHDQVANACGGTRLGQLISPARQRLAMMLLLCAPNLPMLFMGEEFGASTPFYYFTSFPDPALGHAVSEGRRQEYADFFRDEPFPDPQAPATFERSRLDWSETERAPHRGILEFNRALIALRKANPSLANCRKDLTRVICDDDAGWLTLERGDPCGSAALLLCNFAGSERSVRIEARKQRWRLALWSGDPTYHAAGAGDEPSAALDQGDTMMRLAALSAALYLRE
ncbi:MAG: malto-oligosyltrehalose trehalohydrolase [Candidatus Binataceae bacterium]